MDGCISVCWLCTLRYVPVRMQGTCVLKGRCFSLKCLVAVFKADGSSESPHSFAPQNETNRKAKRATPKCTASDKSSASADRTHFHDLDHSGQIDLFLICAVYIILSTARNAQHRSAQHRTNHLQVQIAPTSTIQIILGR